MRTIVYVDGFNLYFRLLQKRPALKWLNVKALAERVLRPTNQGSSENLPEILR
jgi:hypothetical protein